MVEPDFRDEVLALLEDRYGEDQVSVEPTLRGETTVYPDIAVFTDKERTTPFLLVECSSLRTAHRTQRDLDEISDALSSTDAAYGALLAPEVQFVFSGTGPAYRTYAEFPAIDEAAPTDRRAVQSRSELDFLVNRALAAQDTIRTEPRREEQTVEELLESLHLLLEARRHGTKNRTDISQEMVSELYANIADRYEWYQTGQELESEYLTVVSHLFAGYDLAETDDQILESLFELTGDDKHGGEYSTPLEVARQMVRLTGPEAGEMVLDPAAGEGTILSLAAAEGAQGVGIEINVSVLSLASFYMDLFDRDVQLFAGNFFETGFDSSELPDSFDHAIIDPPFAMKVEGGNIPHTGERRTLNSGEAFLGKALSLLTDGGSVTITVPSSFLHTVREKEIRSNILEDFQVDSVIQVIDGPLYRYTSIDTAFITVTNSSPTPSHEIQYEIVESPDEPVDALAEAVTAIKSGDSNSVAQADLDNSLNLRMIVGQRSAREALKEQFSEVVELQSVAEIQTGNPPQEAVETPTEDTLRYLSISDLSDGESRHGDRFIPETEARAIADDSCILLSTLGTYTYTHIPADPVAPAQDIALICFSSPDEALVYETFLSSESGLQQLTALRSGSRIPRVNIRDLRELSVPRFTDEEIQKRAASIREHQQQIAELEAEREQLERKQDTLAKQASDLLTGGDDDE